MLLVRKRLGGWVLFVLCALLAPFISMQFTNEINWDLTDFLVMGSLLSAIGIGYEFIVRKSKETTYRMAYAVGVVGAFLLFWVNGAVGIIGSENQEANLLYGAVWIVGFVGTLIARFKAKGMATTLLIAAVVQMLVPTVALIIWPPSQISWSPSVLGVFLLSSFFAFLFLLSSMLFKRSADAGMNVS